MSQDTDEAQVKATKAVETATAIRSLLAGKGPDVQGGALAELVATWLGGHRPDLREITLKLWLSTVRDLVPICEAEIFADKPRPEGWRAS